MAVATPPRVTLAATGDTLSARDFRVWRLFTWAGVVYLVGALGSFAGVARFLPPPRENWSAGHVAAFFRDHEVGIRLGMEGILAVGLFYALLSYSLFRLMERVEGRRGFLSWTQLLGGVITALITMGCAVFWLAASFRAGSRDPRDIQALNDVGWMVFDMTVMATVFQYVAFGVVCLLDSGRRPLLPRWLGYLSFWAAFTFFAVFFMPSFKSGPLSWQGLVTFYVALGAFFVWIAAVIPTALNAITRLEREQSG
ncbi:MAG: DUF4386 family protein [Actinobacteria bacterium]|nr:MAG: DUF4386 family protein [Actinomycetota bacterium]